MHPHVLAGAADILGRRRHQPSCALFGAVLLTVLLLGTVNLARADAILLHEYNFTSGATDSVGTMHGTLFGDASTAGGVLTLDGSGDYVELSGYAIPTGAFSITFNAASGGQGSGFTEIISQGRSGAPGFYIGTYPWGDFRLGDLIGTSVSYPYDGLFHSFALTSGPSGTRFYIDSLLVYSTTTIASAPNSDTFTRIGRQFGDNLEYFRGQIDDLRIYSGELMVGVPLQPALSAQMIGLALFGGLLVWRRRRSVGR